MRGCREQDDGMDKLLTWEEAAERLNTTPRHVRRLVFERRIAYRKLGRYVRFHPDDLEEYISANRVEVGRVAAGRTGHASVPATGSAPDHAWSLSGPPRSPSLTTSDAAQPPPADRLAPGRPRPGSR